VERLGGGAPVARGRAGGDLSGAATRFDIKLTAQDKSALVAFLRSL